MGINKYAIMKPKIVLLKEGALYSLRPKGIWIKLQTPLTSALLLVSYFISIVKVIIVKRTIKIIIPAKYIIHFRLPLLILDIIKNADKIKGDKIATFELIKRTIKDKNLPLPIEKPSEENANKSYNAIKTQDYTYNDAINTNASILYYRLKMVDNDGSYIYSNIVSLKLNELNFIFFKFRMKFSLKFLLHRCTMRMP